jgi:hypothetical protein
MAGMIGRGTRARKFCKPDHRWEVICNAAHVILRDINKRA